MSVLTEIAAIWRRILALEKRLTIAGGGAPPSRHASSHYDGGSDEVDITQLGGFPGGSPVLYLDSDGNFSDPSVTGGGGSPGGSPVDEARTAVLDVVIDGAGAAITTGIKVDVRVPVDCELVANYLYADQTGSIVIDVWKDTHANFPATDADSITASAPPTISSANKSSDTTLTGWTTALITGDVLRFNVDSCTSITRVTLQLVVSY